MSTKKPKTLKSKNSSPKGSKHRAPKVVEPIEPPEQEERGIRIYVRVRPKLLSEAKMETFVQHTWEPRVLTTSGGKTWDVHGVLYQDCMQGQVYQMCADHALEAALTGKTAAVICCGQHGSGKTHTVRGTLEDPGIIPRIAGALFSALSGLMGYNYSVTASCIQLCRTHVKDLLSVSSDSAAHVLLNGDAVVFENLSAHPVNSAAALVQLYDHADTQKSSWSLAPSKGDIQGNCILTLDIQISPMGYTLPQASQHGKLHIVEVAGYEPVSSAAIDDATALKEAKFNNSTVLCLKRAVAARARGEALPVDKDCLLPALLKDALGHEGFTSLILTLSPLASHRLQTNASLSFVRSVMVPEAGRTALHPGKKDWDSLRAKVVGQASRAHQLAQWLKKANPKELKRFEAQFGKLDVSELSEQKLEQTLEVMEGLFDTMPKPTVIEDSDTSHQEMQNLWIKFIRRQQSEKEQCTKEMEDLKLQHSQELTMLQRQGASEEDVFQLRSEHLFEMDLLQFMQEQHHAFLWEEFGVEVQTSVLRSAAKYKLLEAQAEACLAGTSGSVDFQHLHELCLKEGTFHGYERGFASIEGSSDPTSLPVLSVSTITAQTKDNLLNLLKSAPVQEAGQGTFNYVISEEDAQQEQSDIAADSADEDDDRPADLPNEASVTSTPQGSKSTVPDKAAAKDTTSSLHVEVQGNPPLEKTVWDLIHAAVGLAESSGRPKLVNDMLDLYHTQKPHQVQVRAASRTPDENKPNNSALTPRNVSPSPFASPVFTTPPPEPRYSGSPMPVFSGPTYVMPTASVSLSSPYQTPSPFPATFQMSSTFYPFLPNSSSYSVTGLQPQAPSYTFC